MTRRYSEFAWLHRQLGAEGLPSQILPRLPGKLLAVPRIDEDADTADHAALLRRQGELDLFLRALLRLPQLRTSLALKQFLASDAPPQGQGGSLHGPGGVPPGGPAASVTAVMLAMPTVENWMRFCAEERHVCSALELLELREAHALRRLADGERRAAARDERLRRWREHEEPAARARRGAVASRDGALRRAVRVSEERLRLQRSTRQLLQLAGCGDAMGSLSEQHARTLETTGYEELSGLSERWGETTRLESGAVAEERTERSQDEENPKWNWEEVDWLMRHASWSVEVSHESPPPETIELVAQRERLGEVRARLEQLLAAETRLREEEAEAAPAQNELLLEVRAKLDEERRLRAEEARMILAACDSDELEKGARKAKESELEARLDETETLSMERSDLADKRSARCDARSMRRQGRREHAAARAEVIEAHRQVLHEAETAQRERLETEARRAERQRPAQPLVRARTSALVGVRAAGRSRSQRGRAARDGSTGPGASESVVSFALLVTRVPAQRLYLFDRSREDAGRSELLRACDEVEASVAAARVGVESAESEIVKQRHEIREAAASRAQAAAQRASCKLRSESAEEVGSPSPNGEVSRGAALSNVLSSPSSVETSTRGGTKPTKAAKRKAKAAAKAAKAAAEASGATEPSTTEPPSSTRSRPPAVDTRSSALVVPSGLDGDPFLRRALGRKRELEGAIEMEARRAEAEALAEAAELAELRDEALELRHERELLHALSCTVCALRCDLQVEMRLLEQEGRDRAAKKGVVTGPLAATRVQLLLLPPQVDGLSDILRFSIDATQCGLSETAALRDGTQARSAARDRRVGRELGWLRDAKERLAQQRASQARLYVDMAQDEVAQRESADEAKSSELQCARARAAIVPLSEQLEKERAALAAAAEREVQLARQADTLQLSLEHCAALYPGLALQPGPRGAESESDGEARPTGSPTLSEDSAQVVPLRDESNGRPTSPVKGGKLRRSGSLLWKQVKEKHVWLVEEDHDFVGSVRSSLASLLSTHGQVRDELEQVRATIGKWVADTSRQASALDELAALLAEEQAHASDEQSTRARRQKAERERTALADALSAMMAAWLQTAESEAEALAIPLAKAHSELQMPAPAPPTWLESGLDDAAEALAASQERLCHRESELERLARALEEQEGEEEGEGEDEDASFLHRGSRNLIADVDGDSGSHGSPRSLDGLQARSSDGSRRSSPMLRGATSALAMAEAEADPFDISAGEEGSVSAASSSMSLASILATPVVAEAAAQPLVPPVNASNSPAMLPPPLPRPLPSPLPPSLPPSLPPALPSSLPLPPLPPTLPLPPSLPPLPQRNSIPDDLWEARKLEEVRETAAAQATLRPLSLASSDAVHNLASQVLELRELQARLESARKTLARRVELWDADELAPKWAATASWLHPKDKSTAQLLERRRAAYKRAEQLLKQATGLVLTNALPYRAKMVSELQARCADVQAALLPPTILMAEEVAVADQLAALAFLFSSGLGPGPTENARHTPNLVDSSRSTIASPVNLRSPSRNNMGPEQAAETASRGHASGHAHGHGVAHGVAHGIARARTTPQEWLSSQYAERRVDL